MEIRSAEYTDLKDMLEIYNYEVLNGVATLDLHPKGLAEWTKWFDAHKEKNFPVLIAEEYGKIVGYACLSSYREKEAFISTAELSVYVAVDCRGCKIATKLMENIIQQAKADTRFHLIISVITDGNKASESLHNKFGFKFCGTISEAGSKFGQYQNISNYTLKV